MIYLVMGLVVFLGIHSIGMTVPHWRARMLEKLGEGPWKGIYSVVTLVGLVLLIYGYGVARRDPVVLYAPPYWMRHVTMLLMLPVFPMLFAAYFPGRINAALKHPMLAAVKLWAFAHLLSNGMLADLLLFGGFLAWAVADRISMKRRPPQVIRIAPPSRFNDAIAVAAGLAVYVAFVLWLHTWLIGVPAATRVL